MKLKGMLFPAGAVLVVVFLYVLSMTGRKPPYIPRDADHAALGTKEGCLTCHAPGKVSPLKEKHPPKDQCFECHKIKPGDAKTGG